MDWMNENSVVKMDLIPQEWVDQLRKAGYEAELEVSEDKTVLTTTLGDYCHVLLARDRVHNGGVPEWVTNWDVVGGDCHTVFGERHSSWLEALCDINEWCWVVNEYEKSWNELNEDLRLKEWTLIGASVEMSEFPDSKDYNGSYTLATIRYSDKSIDISFTPKDAAWYINGVNTRKTEYEDFKDVLKSLHRRIKMRLKK